MSLEWRGRCMVSVALCAVIHWWRLWEWQVGRSCDLASRSQYRGVGALGSIGSKTLLFSVMKLARMLILSPWLVMMMRTLTGAGAGRSCDSASRSHDTKASVVQDPKVSGHYFVFQHRASRNVDSVSMVGYDNDCSLARTEEPSDCAKSCKNVWLQNLRCSLLLPSVRRAFRRSRHQTPWGDPALAYLECSRIVWDIPEPERQRELNKSLLSIS